MKADDAYAAHLLPIAGGYHQIAGLHLLEPSLRMKKDGSIDPENEQDGFENGLPVIRECADRCHAVVKGKIRYHCMSPSCAEHYTGIVTSDVCKNCPVRRGRGS